MGAVGRGISRQPCTDMSVQTYAMVLILNVLVWVVVVQPSQSMLRSCLWAASPGRGCHMEGCQAQPGWPSPSYWDWGVLAAYYTQATSWCLQ